MRRYAGRQTNAGTPGGGLRAAIGEGPAVLKSRTAPRRFSRSDCALGVAEPAAEVLQGLGKCS